MYSSSLINVLETRVTEIEWFGQQHQMRVEPHLYPKGLFRVQFDVVKCYQLSAYVEELRHDLNALKKLNLPLMRSKAAEKLLQKVNVLINGFQSQSLRRKTSNGVNKLVGNIDLVNDNIYEKMVKKGDTGTKAILIKQLKKQQSDLINLTQSREVKQQALTKEKDSQQQALLTKMVLEMSKQIGCIEQKITRIKEELDKRPS